MHTRLVENPIVSKQDSFVSILWSMCYGKSSTPFILHLNLEKTNYMYSSPLYVNHTCDVSLFTNHCVVCIIRAVLCILRHELCILLLTIVCKQQVTFVTQIPLFFCTCVGIISKKIGPLQFVCISHDFSAT